jgi:hypothetical protein
MTNNDRPKNQAQFEYEEVERQFGLENFVSLSTNELLVILRKLVRNLNISSKRPLSNGLYIHSLCCLSILE